MGELKVHVCASARAGLPHTRQQRRGVVRCSLDWPTNPMPNCTAGVETSQQKQHPPPPSLLYWMIRPAWHKCMYARLREPVYPILVSSAVEL